MAVLLYPLFKAMSNNTKAGQDLCAIIPNAVFVFLEIPQNIRKDCFMTKIKGCRKQVRFAAASFLQINTSVQRGSALGLGLGFLRRGGAVRSGQRIAAGDKFPHLPHRTFRCNITAARTAAAAFAALLPAAAPRTVSGTRGTVLHRVGA